MNEGRELPLSEQIAGLIRDLLRMADLQIRLLSLDATAMVGSLKRSLFAAGLAFALLIGALPVMMFGVAGTIHILSGLRIEFSWLLVGGLMTVLGIGLAWFAVSRFRSSIQSLQRSNSEFQQNIAWVRSMLHRSST